MCGVCIITRQYTHDLHIRITEDQGKFITNDVKTDYSQYIRKLIDARKNTHNKDLAILEAEFAVVEPRYFTLLKQIEELKSESKRLAEEALTKEKRIEEAHEKLLEVLERYNWHPERIQRATYKIYADFTGESIENLEAWVKEKAKTRGD